MHNLGLLPLVKKLRIYEGIHRDFDGFSSQRFNYCIRRRFVVLTNIRELEIDRLDTPSFIPRIRHYFGHFLPTVRSLVLREPKGCRRQILCFIGMFQHLEDLKLLFRPKWPFLEPGNHPTLTPPFTPPLRGRLNMTFVRWVEFLKDMVGLFGGIRFRHMELVGVSGMRLLLDACVETLETLRLYPIVPSGEQLPPKGVRVLTNDFAVGLSLQDVDLSRNKSLRTLEVMARSIDDALRGRSRDAASNLLKHALSTITSHALLEIIVIYQDYDFRGIRSPWACSARGPLHVMSQAERAREASRHLRQFGVLRELHKVRDFQLLLCADVWDRVGEYSVKVLKEAVEAGGVKGTFDGFSPKPMVIHSPRVAPAGVREELYAGGLTIPWTSM